MSMEKSNLEKREQSITIETITSQDLVDLIYKGESTPQDNRFLPIDEGGVFKYFHLSDLIGINGRKDKKSYVLSRVGDTVVGLAELEEDPYLEGNLWVKFISVDPLYQNKGHGSRLVGAVFEFAKEHGFSLGISRFSDDGGQKLKRVIVDTAKNTSVTVIDEHKQLNQ